MDNSGSRCTTSTGSPAGVEDVRVAGERVQRPLGSSGLPAVPSVCGMQTRGGFPVLLRQVVHGARVACQPLSETLRPLLQLPLFSCRCSLGKARTANPSSSMPQTRRRLPAATALALLAVLRLAAKASCANAFSENSQSGTGAAKEASVVVPSAAWPVAVRVGVRPSPRARRATSSHSAARRSRWCAPAHRTVTGRRSTTAKRAENSLALQPASACSSKAMSGSAASKLNFNV